MEVSRIYQKKKVSDKLLRDKAFNIVKKAKYER